MYVVPYFRIVDSLVFYSLKIKGKSFMYVDVAFRCIQELRGAFS